VSRFRTGVSSTYEGEAPKSALTAEEESRAGLVLLYAPRFEELAAAYPFYTSEVIVGRDATCSICIPDQAVSRNHVRLDTDGETWTLHDLSSRNGTIVNGQYVSEHVLEELDEVRIGDAIFKFVPEGATAYVPFRLDGSRGKGVPAATAELVGGHQIDAIARDIERIAPTELSCMILGETGTGKEVVARAIHRLSERKGSLQAINCAAIPQNLLESELFGYRRGAFSGADRDKPGLIKLADGGTLFLDEIGDMPLEAQAKLLRVLQAKEVFPLGATTAERVDVRVACATHRNLREQVRDGKFRGDLFARLNEHAVSLPPLRQRKEDIYLLAKTFAARYGRPDVGLTFSFLLALVHYDWPYNVRELESCIKRGLALTGGAPLDAKHLPEDIAERMKEYGDKKRATATPESREVPPKRSAPTEAELRALLERHQGNIAAVGRELGKERMQVHRWLKKYGISLDGYRSE
jgi:sigma-54 dependent transcriptional regulator, acetoin dehydrogenase operon transcriptional activator AcoR